MLPLCDQPSTRLELQGEFQQSVQVVRELRLR